jgi:hypothetical protein
VRRGIVSEDQGEQATVTATCRARGRQTDLDLRQPGAGRKPARAGGAVIMRMAAAAGPFAARSGIPVAATVTRIAAT